MSLVPSATPLPGSSSLQSSIPAANEWRLQHSVRTTNGAAQHTVALRHCVAGTNFVLLRTAQSNAATELANALHRALQTLSTDTFARLLGLSVTLPHPATPVQSIH